MVDTAIQENLSIVEGLVEPDDYLDVLLLKVVKAVLEGRRETPLECRVLARLVAVLLCDPRVVDGRGKGDKARCDPVPVPIFHLFIVLVFINGKLVHVAETILHGLPDTPKAVLYTEIKVRACSTGISEWHELHVCERVKCLPWRTAENDLDIEGEEKGSVCLFTRIV